jgi:hypothetical protein
MLMGMLVLVLVLVLMIAGRAASPVLMRVLLQRFFVLCGMPVLAMRVFFVH